MASTVLQFRVDENLKKESQSIFEQLGLDFPTAFRIFLTRCVEECGLPFEMKAKRNSDSEKKKYLKKIVDKKLVSKKSISELLEIASNEAIKNGLSEMTMEEIDAEIESYREEK